MKDTCKFSLLCLKSMTVQALVAKKSIRTESHGEVGWLLYDTGIVFREGKS
jgi:hypothetical protein